jgi:uncharacterized protein (TIGR02145 family)
MKTKFVRILLPILSVLLLSCQEPATQATSLDPTQIQVVPRLVSVTGDTLPAADTVEFRVRIGNGSWKTTRVAWKSRSASFGLVNVGDSLFWQVSAWKWNAAQTQRTVVWTSKPCSTVARLEGSATTLSVSTPTMVQDVPAPALFQEIGADADGHVAVAYADIDWLLVLQPTTTMDTVKVNGVVLKDTSGIYRQSMRLSNPGDTLPVRVSLQDASGGLTIRMFTLVRASSAAADLSLKAVFHSPATDTVIEYLTDSVKIAVHVEGAQKADSVRLVPSATVVKTNDTTWTATLRGLKVGATLVTATPYLGDVAKTSASLTVTRKPDSSSTLSLVSPARLDTVYAFADSTPTISLRSSSAVKVDAVLLSSGDTLHRNASDTALWSGRVHLTPGDTLKLTATPHVGKVAGTPLEYRLYRLKVGAADSTIFATLSSPSKDASVPNGTTSLAVQVKVTSNSKLHMDSVMLEGVAMTKGTADTTLWNGTTGTLKVGPNPFLVTAHSGSKTAVCSLLVTRRNALGKISFTPGFGTYDTARLVKIFVPVSGATIEIRHNGVWTSYKDSALALVDTAQTLDVRAWKDGYDTALGNAEYKISTVARPIFSFPAGKYATSKTVSITSATPGATIQYKFGADGAWTNYSDPVEVASTSTLYAKASRTDMTDMTDKIDSASYKIQANMDTVVFGLADPLYYGPQTLRLTCETKDATIEYQLDGTRGTWLPYPKSGIQLSTSTVVYARASAKGTDTATTFRNYTIKPLPNKPTFSSKGGTFNAPQTLTLTAGDGSKNPVTKYSADKATWNTYTAGNLIAVDSSQTIWAYDSVPNQANSLRDSVTFNLYVSAPKVSSTGGTYSNALSLTITDSTPNAVIEFRTKAGASWTGWNTYNVNGGITVSIGAATSLEVKATRIGFTPSAIVTENYSFQVAKPKFVVKAGQFADTVTVSDSTNGAVLLTTLDSLKGWDTTTGGSKEIILFKSDTVYAKALYSTWPSNNAAKAVLIDPNFQDGRDRASYKWVRIGSQIWMAENLKYSASSTIGRCYNELNDDPNAFYNGYEGWTDQNGPDSNCAKYGRLYNISEAQTACPTGWSLPKDADWQLLEKTAGMLDADLDKVGSRGETQKVGKILKGAQYWSSGTGGTDSLGFNALPAGRYSKTYIRIDSDYPTGFAMGGYKGLNGNAYWWTKTPTFSEVQGGNMYYNRELYPTSDVLDGVGRNLENLIEKDSQNLDVTTDVHLSVRCVHE